MTTKLYAYLIAACVLFTGCDHSKSNKDQTEQESAELPAPFALLVEGHPQVPNLHTQEPGLSWRVSVASQSAYQIQVASTEEQLINGSADLWDSGEVKTGVSRNIAYQGKKLSANQAAFWRVRIWQAANPEPSAWSKPAFWQMGLIEKSDWQARWLQSPKRQVAEKNNAIDQWIKLVGIVEKEAGGFESPALEKLTAMPGASFFKNQFSIKKQVLSARLHSTAAGYYEIFVNGERVKDRLMDPGQTDFDKRILYNTDEVTEFIREGSNSIGVHLGSGWYNEDIAFSRWKDPDGNYADRANGSYSFGEPSFIAQLELVFSDGSRQVVSSNESWLTHPSPVIKEGIFSGELYDASKHVPGWHSVSSEHSKKWMPAKALDEWPTAALEPQLLPPIRAVKDMQSLRLLEPEKGKWVFDFGQNFTGIPTLHLNELTLEPGHAIFLRFAEWADDTGNISQLSGGGWATHLNAVDAYIAGDDNEDSWTPSFTWHGFRYVELSGLKEAPTLAALSARQVRSDVVKAGNFTSSDELLNRIHRTALWTYESNLMSVPLDCPIREKAGWTGDAHAALVTGNYNYNMESFWPKYLGDFKTAIHTAPTVVPGKRTGGGKVDWAVAEVFIAWEHYRHHGKLQILRDQYESLTEYMDFGQTQMSEYLISEGYGDWCDPVKNPGTPRVGGRGTPQWTSTTVTSTALFTRAADLMSKISAVIGLKEDSKRYALLYENLRDGFHNALYNAETGHYGSQTADAMALRFGITPPELRQSVADALNRDVVENWNGHSSVGALGQTWLYLALSDYGYADTAFKIFKAEGYPGFSYLFNDLNGTTLWERKGAYDPSSGRGPVRSLNHPFHSGYDGWFYQGLGGIRPLENSVGFQEFMLKPVFPSDLDSVDVNYDSGYGNIASSWLRSEGSIEWQFTIPNNTRAWVHLPNKDKKLYEPGTYSVSIDH